MSALLWFLAGGLTVAIGGWLLMLLIASGDR